MHFWNKCSSLCELFPEKNAALLYFPTWLPSQVFFFNNLHLYSEQPYLLYIVAILLGREPYTNFLRRNAFIQSSTELIKHKKVLHHTVNITKYRSTLPVRSTRAGFGTAPYTIYVVDEA